MNTQIRNKIKKQNIGLVDYVLQQIDQLEQAGDKPRTIFAACPNSIAVIKAALRSAKRCNAPIKFAATLNQVDLDGGYTGMKQDQFVKTIRKEARKINYTGPVMIAVDHGGPWLKDQHRKDNYSYEKSMDSVKKSFEASIAAGYDLLHVDPTIDIRLKKDEIIDIDTVAARTIELIVAAEKFRTQHNYPPISYEVGTEEVHGGLANYQVFERFLKLLKKGLQEAGLKHIFPALVVAKVGTDLHTTLFDKKVAREVTAICKNYGSVIKGHYSDNVENPEDYPKSGMGGANVGPEFTEKEYEGLMELTKIEETLCKNEYLAKKSNLKNTLWDNVIESDRWQKWLTEDENPNDFYANDKHRQEWLIKTGCRYIWEKPSVIAARKLLYDNLSEQGIDAEQIVLSKIEQAMDKYFYSFNLINLNDKL
jgi:tagatose-1,6-bisphosphate aldolase non-catalytic subunit AgaZ/GatZ